MAVQSARGTSVSLPLRETQVLSMGVIRTGERLHAREPVLKLECIMTSYTGSLSITEALTILGYKDVHHGITAMPRK